MLPGMRNFVASAGCLDNGLAEQLLAAQVDVEGSDDGAQGGAKASKSAFCR